MAVMGCAAIHRERAPEMMFNTTTPVGFESVVRYANGYAIPELVPGCTGCGACLLVCPDFCFEIYQYEKPISHEVTP